MRVFRLVAIVLTTSCASAPAAKGLLREPGTMYRLGDFVVYRYRGLFTKEPVLLREEIAAQEGNRLRIDVTATRGAETRAWVQILTDTPENQRNNVLDALYERRNGSYVRLANEGNADLTRLYDWILVQPDGRLSDVTSADCDPDFAGTRIPCTCTRGKNTWRGRAVTFEDSDCPTFLWTHGPGGFTDAATGEAVLRIEVLEHGRRADAKAQPLAIRN